MPVNVNQTAGVIINMIHIHFAEDVTGPNTQVAAEHRLRSQKDEVRFLRLSVGEWPTWFGQRSEFVPQSDDIILTMQSSGSRMERQTTQNGPTIRSRQDLEVRAKERSLLSASRFLTKKTIRLTKLLRDRLHSTFEGNLADANTRQLTTMASATLETHRHGRVLLRDISPPGMWPITSDDNELEFSRRRSLLSTVPPNSLSAPFHARAVSLPELRTPTATTYYDGESGATCRRTLRKVGGNSLSTHSGGIVTRSVTMRRRRSLLRDISPPGMWPITSDDDESAVSLRRALFSHRGSIPSRRRLSSPPLVSGLIPRSIRTRLRGFPPSGCIRV
ncbi:hypothetical protein R1flu_026619 [Riccia fluitans]|uniref:Uncharacterized protein n=1 Tax=Riccia fluitans TaxID=41844 RepID=A0ABD1XGH3_9MARC